MVSLDGVAVIAKSPTARLICVLAVVLLARKFWSPLYVAEIVTVPAELKVRAQAPLETPGPLAARLPVQVCPVLAFTETVPVGEATFVEPVTL
jgi:hypothetical protein